LLSTLCKAAAWYSDPAGRLDRVLHLWDKLVAATKHAMKGWVGAMIDGLDPMRRAT